MANYPTSDPNLKTNFNAANTPAVEGHTTQGHNNPNLEINAIGEDLRDTLAAGTETTPAATATNIANRVGQILQMLKNITGGTNWYDSVSATISTIWGKFHSSSGHAHTGASNDGPTIGSSGIAAGAITNSKLATSAGEIGAAWQSWTPSFTNFTLGNGTVTAKYKQIGKLIHFYINVTLGSTSSMGAAPKFTLPVTISSDYRSTGPRLTNALITDNGTADYGAVGLMGSDSKMEVAVLNASGTYITHTQVNSTTPMTWVSGDYFQVEGTYEAA